MRLVYRTLTLLVPTALLVSGCAPSDDESTVGEQIDVSLDPAAGGTFYEPPTGRNGMLPEQFWSPVAQESMREIQHVALSSGGSIVIGSDTFAKLPSLPFTDALRSTYPDVVKYLVECALDPTQAVYDDINNVVHKGWWGLGSIWLDKPTGIEIDYGAQTWITGCMVARLNNLGVHVDILLEGAVPPIEVSSAYDGAFNYDESAVFGNMFSSTFPLTTNDPPFFAYVCREEALAHPKTGMCPSDGGKNWLDKRLCDNAPATCGLIDLGRCPTGGGCIQHSANPQHWACREGDGTGFYFGPYHMETVGVELYTALTPSECDN